MKLHLFEARTAGDTGGNWGKFAVGIPGTEEWSWRSAIPDFDGELPSAAPLLHRIGWTPRHIWVIDLQTGEGAIFHHGGFATADLEKHAIWVCVLFEAFLAWVYRQDLADIETWPRVVELDVPVAFYGYRRPGPQPNWHTVTLPVIAGGRGTCIGTCQR